MEPDWIQDAHARWLDGEECNVTEEAEQHRLRPFKSLKISISGIEDCKYNVTFHDSSHSPTISEPAKITHQVYQRLGRYLL